MLRTAVRAKLAACAAALVLPVSVAAAPAPKPHLSEILAEPPSEGYVEVQSHTPGVLEGPFDAGEYASIGGADYGTTFLALRNDGFIAGYARAWVQLSPGRVLVEIVVAFSGGTGAKAWLQQSELADLADPNFKHSISVDGIETYYGARMSDSMTYFADAFLFVKGNDGFLVSTISSADDLGDSAAEQTRVQYRRAPPFTIPPSGWPGAAAPQFTIADAAALGLAAVALIVSGAVLAAARRRRKRYSAGSSGL
jgi:hypothetical protein